MVISNTAKNRIRDLIHDDIGVGEMGTGTNVPLESDTGLQTPISASRATVTKSKSDRTVSITHTLNSATGNGNTFSEFGVFLNSDADMLNRVVFPGIAKTNAFELSTTVVYRVR